MTNINFLIKAETLTEIKMELVSCEIAALLSSRAR